VNVLVDTSVWSLALRRAAAGSAAVSKELQELVHEGRTVMIGPIRQELLSGVRTTSQFSLLREHLRAFPDQPITTGDYEEAAIAFNRCRGRGIQGSNTDFLMCAVSLRLEVAIFTTDHNFERFARVVPIQLHSVRS